MSRDAHWQEVYAAKGEGQTSWFRPHLDESLRLIDSLALAADAAIIDVGAGRSTLVDDLQARGYSDLTNDTDGIYQSPNFVPFTSAAWTGVQWDLNVAAAGPWT